MMPIKVDTLIDNGTVVDPARSIYGRGRIAVVDRRFVALPDSTSGVDVDADTMFDASGCLVVPGLIDFHCHFFFRHTFTGLPPDMAFLCAGVTTAVDHGSAGIANFLGFIQSASLNMVKFKAFLHVSAPGQSSIAYAPEPYVPEKWDRKAFRAVLDDAGDRACGLKMRTSKNAVFGQGERAFYESVKLAEDLGTRLTVHIPDPPMPQSHIARTLRPGDAMSHIFHNKGHTIFENNMVAPEVREAQQRGVFMDVAHGGVHLGFELAARAIAEDFAPDIISTDQVMLNWLAPEVYNLNYVMSQFLALGMNVPDIIRAVTATPARAVGLEGKAGAMAPGMPADLTILRLVDRDLTFQNLWGEIWPGRHLFVTQAVLLDGKLVYKPLDSCVRRYTREFGWSL